MDKLFVLAASIKLLEITDATVQTQLFNIKNLLNIIGEFKEKAKSEDVKGMELKDMNDVKTLEDYLKDHEVPLERDTYYDLLSKLRGLRVEMGEVEDSCAAQREEAEEDEDEEGDMKVRAMVTKLMSSTKNSILRDDRDFISKVLLEYLELKKKSHE